MMKRRSVLVITFFAIALIAIVAFVVTKYLQPILPPEVNSTLVLAVIAIAGTAGFLAALNESSQFIERIFSKRPTELNNEEETPLPATIPSAETMTETPPASTNPELVREIIPKAEARFSFKSLERTQTHHEYLLEIRVKNNTAQTIDSFKLQFTFPDNGMLISRRTYSPNRRHLVFSKDNSNFLV
jgi:hypothetical protein